MSWNGQPWPSCAGEGEEPVAPRPDYLFRHAVADWAKQYSKATGTDLSDLAALKRKRPHYARARLRR